MQDRYAGDVGDFGKFSLLREVFADTSNKIGVVWYKYPDESHNGDGRHTAYLRNNDYKNCDNELVKKLSHVVASERTILKLESLQLLPENTVYYHSELNFHVQYPSQTNLDKTARKDKRLQWLNNAVNSVNDCNVIFLDPDNGLEIPSIPGIHQKKSGKYTYYSEVCDLFKNKDACVIYHHINMNEPHESQIIYRAEELKTKLGNNVNVFVIRYSPYSPRAFFICAEKVKSEGIKKKINNYINGACGIGWDSYYET
ncbi:MAG: hypothetical protein GY834_03080 [Bacteroidetes bacterium]|nr:hypothetical protein [Bacteroidota bacterium]